MGEGGKWEYVVCDNGTSSDEWNATMPEMLEKIRSFNSALPKQLVPTDRCLVDSRG